MAKGGKHDSVGQFDSMMAALGGASFDRLSDGSWVCGAGIGEVTGSGETPYAALVAAWETLAIEE